MAKHKIKSERKTSKSAAVNSSDNKSVAAHTTGLKSMSNWLVVLILILPVLFSRSTLDPTIVIRYIFLSGFILVFLLYFYTLKRIDIFPNPAFVKAVFILGIGFAAWSIISLFSAINISIGYYEISRHLMNLILLYLVMVTVANEDSQVLKLCKAILLVSIIQSFVGILQFYDLAFSDIPGANAKPFGLMANRNLFGSAQVLVMPFVIYVLYKAGKAWKYTAIIALTGIIVSIIISQTRSAWISSTVILLLSLLLVTIFSKPNRKRWITGFLITSVSITAFVLLVLLSNREGELSKSIKERTNLSASTTESVNTNERVKIWGKTVQLIKDHPVFGVGIGNWKIVIPQYGTEGLVWAKGHYVPDRPHNVYLQISSETGIPGAILYFGMWIVIVIIFFKVIIQKTQSEDRRILIILMLCGLAAFATDCMFSFPAERIEHSLYITLMSGIILGCYFTPATEKTHRQNLNWWWLVTMLLTVAFNLFIGFKKNNFETHMNLAMAFNKEKRYQDVIDEAEAGKNNFVTIDQEGKSLEIYSSVAYTELKDYKKGLEELNAAKKYNPNSLMVYNNMGTIYTEMKDYNKAIEYYLKALKLAPKMDIALKNLAINYFNIDNYAGCIEALNKVEDKEQDKDLLNNLINEAKRRMELQTLQPGK